MQLSEIQIIYIKNDLKSRKTSSGFRPELLDHLCSMVETKLAEGLDFSSAYAQVLNEFTPQGFIALTTQSAVVKKKRMVVSTQLLGAMLAASVFMFVLGVGAQAPPQMSPIPSAVISASFGMRMHPILKTNMHHKGIDLKCPSGTPIVASGDGEVIFAGVAESTYGNKIIIEHDEHFQTIYAHLSNIKVKKGQLVKKGNVIGLVGQTGNATGPHLHYEVIQDGEYVDPVIYMAKHE